MRLMCQVQTSFADFHATSQHPHPRLHLMTTVSTAHIAADWQTRLSAVHSGLQRFDGRRCDAIFTRVRPIEDDSRRGSKADSWTAWVAYEMRSTALLSTRRSGHQAAAASLRHSIQSIRDRTAIITLASMHLYFGVDRDKEGLLNYLAADTVLDKSNVVTESGDSTRQIKHH